MKIIDLNYLDGVSAILYPDNQPHVNVNDIKEGDNVKVICSITDSIKLFQLLEVSNAIENLFAIKKELAIPYLMGARFDRIMQSGDSFDLKVVSDLINLCGFQKVYLFDVHSDVSTALIKNSINASNIHLVQAYDTPNSILICPDAGAAKKIGKYFEWNKNIVDVVYCIKSRDLSNGNLTLKVLEPEKCKGRNCVIVDDLCDGGGTFIGIAEQINPASLSLVVTHGIFSKGFSLLEKYFNEIIVSDSYCHTYNSNIVKLIKHPL